MRVLSFLLVLGLAWPCLGADCDSVGPRRSVSPEYVIKCNYLADTATGTGNRTICTDQLMENADEWYFFISQDTGATNIAISIHNFFEVDDDPTVIGQLTDENPEFRWIRLQDGNLHKSLRAVIVTADGPPTDLDVQVCVTRYIHQ